VQVREHPRHFPGAPLSSLEKRHSIKHFNPSLSLSTKNTNASASSAPLTQATQWSELEAELALAYRGKKQSLDHLRPTEQKSACIQSSSKSDSSCCCCCIPLFISICRICILFPATTAAGEMREQIYTPRRLIKMIDISLSLSVYLFSPPNL
jgi:hypothetical protein